MNMLLALALQAVTAPYPDTLSKQALDGLAADATRPVATGLPAQRAKIDAIQQEIGQRRLARFGVTVTDTKIAGVPVRVFTPRGGAKPGAVLMNLHGGGFVVDAGSLTENVHIAARTGRQVVAVRYRLAPEHPFPAALDDALAVYRALLQRDGRIALYGTSAGAILSAQLVGRLKADGFPLPVALGFFSGSADLSRLGDSIDLFASRAAADGVVAAYAGGRPATDVALSPGRGDMNGWPPTLCIASTRDFLLSASADFCRRLDLARNDARLVVYDGLPHAFWAYIDSPESDTAFGDMARFLSRQLERK